MAKKSSIIEEIKKSIKVPGNIAQRIQMPSVTTAEVNQGSLFSLLAYIMGGSKTQANDEKAAISKIKKPLPVLFENISDSVDSLRKRIETDAQTVREFNLSSKTLGELNSLADLPYKNFMSESVDKLNATIDTYLTAIPPMIRKVIETIEGVSKTVNQMQRSMAPTEEMPGESANKNVTATIDPKALQTILQDINTHFDTITHKIFVNTDSEGFQNLLKLSEIAGKNAQPSNIPNIIMELYEGINQISQFNVKPIDDKVKELENTFNSLSDLPQSISVDNYKESITKLNDIVLDLEIFYNELANIDFTKLEDSIKNIGTIADMFGTVDKKQANTISKNISIVNNLFKKDISRFIETLSEFNDEGFDIGKAYGKLEDVVLLIQPLKDLEGIKNIKSKDIKNALNAVRDNIKNVNKLLQAIIEEVDTNLIDQGRDKFKELNKFLSQDIPQTERAAMIGAASMKKTEGLFDSIFKSIDNIGQGLDNSNTYNISIALEGLGKTIFLMGLTMILGGWILTKHQDLIEASLQFGFVMTSFLFSVMLPVGIMARIAGGDTADSIREMGALIAKMSLLLIMAGLVIQLGGGKLVRSAHLFAFELSKFIGSLLVPMLIIGLAARIAKGDSLKEMTIFITKSSAMMMLGALFVLIGHGRLANAAIEFGNVFAKFLKAILMPIAVFSLLMGIAGFAIKDLGKTVLLMASVMSIGALFVLLGGGKFAKAAITFGIILTTFIIGVLAPFVIITKLGGTKSLIELLITVVTLKSLLATATISLMLGALFILISNGKFAIAAMAYTIVFSAFLFAMVLPILVLKKIMPQVVKGLVALTALLIVTTAALVVGAMLVSSGLAWKAIGGALIMSAFMLGMVFIAKMLAKATKDMAVGTTAALQIAAFVAICALSIYILTSAIYTFGAGKVIGAATILGVFTLAIVGIMFLLQKLEGELVQATKAAMILSGAVAILSFALVLVSAIKTKGLGLKILALGGIVAELVALYFAISKVPKKILKDAEKVLMMMAGTIGILALSLWLISNIETEGIWEKLGVLVILVGALGGLYFAISQIRQKILKDAEKVLLQMALSIGLLAFTLILISTIENPLQTLANIGLLILVVGALAGLYFAISKMKKIIAQGGLVILAMGGTILLLAIALKLISDLDPLKTLINTGILILVVGVLSLLYWGLTYLTPIIASGSVAILAMGASVLLIAIALRQLNKVETNGLLEKVSALIKVIGSLGVLYTIMGFPLFALFIMLGSVALMAMSGSLSIFADVVIKLRAIDPTGLNGPGGVIDELKKTVEGAREILSIAWGGIFGLITIRKGSTALAEISAAMVILADAMVKMITAYSILPQSMDSSDKMVEKLRYPIDVFLKLEDILDKAGLLPNTFSMTFGSGKVHRISNGIRTISSALMAIAEPIKFFAASEIPMVYDKDGNVIKTTKISFEQLGLAGENIATFLGFFLGTLGALYEGKEYKTKIEGREVTINSGKVNISEMLDDDDYVENLIEFVKGMGEGIGSIAKGIADYAKLQIPISWDDKGNPNGYKRMKKPDFEAAAENISYVLYFMAGTLIDVMNMDVQGKPFRKYLDEDDLMQGIVMFVGGIGDGIGGIAKGIAEYAKLRIPTQYDDKGNPTAYMKLNSSDFLAAATNINTVLSLLTNTITVWAEQHEDFFEDGDESLASSVMKYVSNLSNVIGSVADGLQKMADLKFPIYDNMGNIIGYNKISNGEIKKSAEVIKEVISSMSKAVVEAYNLDPLTKSEDFGKVVEQLSKIGGLISSIADGIQTFANGGIPQYGKDGKIIGYEQFDMNKHIIPMRDNIKEIMTSMSNAIIDIYYEDPAHTRPKAIFNTTDDNAPIKVAVEGISAIGTMIKNIADGIQVFANGGIPQEWKDGKVVSYKPWDDSSITNVTTNIKKMVLGLFNAVREVADDPQISGILKTFNSSDWVETSNQPIAQLMRGVMGITKPISGIVDIAKNLAELKIPAADAKYNVEKGTWNKYISLFNASGDGKNLFENIKTNITNLVKTLFDAINESVVNIDFEGTKKSIEDLNPVITMTSSLLSNIGKMIDGYSKLSFKEYDKDGNVTKVIKLNPTLLKDAKTNINELLRLIPEAIIGTTDKDGKELKKVNLKDFSETLVSQVGYLTEIANEIIPYIAKINELDAVLNHKDINFKDLSVKLSDILSLIKTDDLADIIEDAEDCVIDFNKALNRFFKQLQKKEDDMIFIDYHKYYRYYHAAAEFFRTLYSSLNGYDPDGVDKRTLFRLIEDNINLFKWYASTIKNISSINIDDLNKGINDFNTFADETIKLINSTNTLLKALENIPDISKDKSEKIKDKFSNVTSLINSLILSLTDNKEDKKIILFSNKNKKRIEKIKQYIEDLNELKKVLRLLSVSEADSIFAIKTASEEAMFVLQQSIDNFNNNVLNQLESDPEKTFNQQYYKDGVNTLKFFTEFVNTNRGDEKLIEKTNNILEAFGIYNDFIKKEIPDEQIVDRFKKEVESIKQLNTSINNIDVGKVMYVKMLVDSMEKLGSRFGDMDKFASAVADKLVEALYSISTETANAAKVIADADKHQTVRQKLITTNINNMKGVVNKTLEVTIKKDENGDTHVTPGSDGGDDNGNTTGPEKKPKSPTKK